MRERLFGLEYTSSGCVGLFVGEALLCSVLVCGAVAVALRRRRFGHLLLLERSGAYCSPAAVTASVFPLFRVMSGDSMYRLYSVKAAPFFCFFSLVSFVFCLFSGLD